MASHNVPVCRQPAFVFWWPARRNLIHTDRETLINLIGHTKDFRHRPKRLTFKIKIQTGYPHIFPVSKQSFQHADKIFTKKVGLID